MVKLKVWALALMLAGIGSGTAEAGKWVSFSSLKGAITGRHAEVPHTAPHAGKTADEALEVAPVADELTDPGVFKFMSKSVPVPTAGEEDKAPASSAAPDALITRMNALPALGETSGAQPRSNPAPVSELGFFAVAGFIPLLIYFSVLYLVVRLIRRTIDRAVWVGGSFVRAFLDGYAGAAPAGPAPPQADPPAAPSGFNLGGLFGAGRAKKSETVKPSAMTSAPRVPVQRMTTVTGARRSTVTRV